MQVPTGSLPVPDTSAITAAAASPADPNTVPLDEIVVKIGGQSISIHAGVACRPDMLRNAPLVVHRQSRHASL